MVSEDFLRNWLTEHTALPVVWVLVEHGFAKLLWSCIWLHAWLCGPDTSIVDQTVLRLVGPVNSVLRIRIHIQVSLILRDELYRS